MTFLKISAPLYRPMFKLEGNSIYTSNVHKEVAVGGLDEVLWAQFAAVNTSQNFRFINYLYHLFTVYV